MDNQHNEPPGEFAPPSSDAAKPQMNLWQRFGGVLVSPRRTFQDIANVPNYWGILSGLMAVSLFSAIITMPKMKEFTRYTLEQTGQSLGAGSGFTPETMEMYLSVMAITTVVVAIIAPILGYLIEAGILKLYAQISLKNATFRQLFSVTLWSAIPAALGGLVHTALVMQNDAKDMLSLQTSFALFLPKGDVTSFAFLFLSNLNFFTLWHLVLLSIGAGAILKQSPVKVGIIIFALWLIYSLIIASFGNFMSTGIA